MKKALFLTLTSIFLYGCAASGERMSIVESSFPALNADSGRVYFYRTFSTFGGGMRETIYVGDQAVGQSIPGGAFYADLPSGTHTITIQSITYPGQSSLQIFLNPNETKYVRTWIGPSGFGGRTNMAIVPRPVAEAAISELAFTGNIK